MAQDLSPFGHGDSEFANRCGIDGSINASRTVSIFADRAGLRAEMVEDAATAGLRVAQAVGLGKLLEIGDIGTLPEVVLVDCPVIDGSELAALSRLDQRALQSGSNLVVSTSMGSLEEVVGCLGKADAKILIAPSRADRVTALGSVLAHNGNRVRELSNEDRLGLLRLTEQVNQIANKLELISSRGGGEIGGVFNFENQTVHGSKFDVQFDGSGDRLVRASRPPLPDPRLVRKIIRHRQLRTRFFEGDLFADPAWDMLLDLTAARVEHVRVSVTSLCIASGVPPTTALRWIGQMTDAGLLRREHDETDRRRAFITLTDNAVDSMAHYFAALTAGAANLI